MLKATWRRLGSPAWLAVGLVFLIPTLAQAQLFPNRTIKRERPPCATEPPFNAQVRRDYFGYYPTCWTRFPAGWACPCPNPELPNYEKSIKDRPLGQTKRPLDDDTAPPMDERNPDDAGDRKPPADGPVPLPNGGRSPFELDPNPKPPAGAPNPGGRNPGTTGALEMPKLPATTPSASYESALQPGSMTPAADARLASGDSTDLRPDLGSLPPAPVSIPNNLAPPGDQSASPTPAAMAPPAQAPRRQSILSKLFGPKDTRNR